MLAESESSPSPDANRVRPGLAPRREVIQAEALAWLGENPALAGSSVITSLPDLSELPEYDFGAWRAWFIEAAQRVMAWVPEDGVAIFFQSDIRYGGAWVDKGYLVQRAAEESSAVLLWHKIVCRHAPGTIAHGRAAYSHMLCVARAPRVIMKRPGPDVLPETGFKPYPKAMGVEACRVACRFLAEETATRVVVDPFCGRGTVLAVANVLGFDAVGVDKSARACRAARKLTLAEATPPADAPNRD
jgi:hypothetical protein